MKPQLNHLIVWATDRQAAADFFAQVAGMGTPTEYGHFTRVETGNGDDRGLNRRRDDRAMTGERISARFNKPERNRKRKGYPCER